MARFELTGPARRDLVDIREHSEERHGERARRRYERLLVTAIRDVAADPRRIGAKERPDLAPGLLSYHLRHSRERARDGGEAVREPRHVLLYRRPSEDLVLIVRVLHDAMDLARHLPPGP